MVLKQWHRRKAKRKKTRNEPFKQIIKKNHENTSMLGNATVEGTSQKISRAQVLFFSIKEKNSNYFKGDT